MNRLEAARVRINEHEQRTPLHCAAITGDYVEMARLLNAGADLEAVCIHGRTALHHAGEFNRPCAVRLLLDRGADPYARDRADGTVLSATAFAGSVESLAVLLLHGVRPRNEIITLDSDGTPMGLFEYLEFRLALYAEDESMYERWLRLKVVVVMLRVG